MTAADFGQADLQGFTPDTLEATRELERRGKAIGRLSIGDLTITAKPGRDTLWILIRRPGKGGIALRTVRSPGELDISGGMAKQGGAWKAISSAGAFDIKLAVLGDELVRVTVSLTPSADLLVPFWPRDIYPIDSKGNPTRATGRVEASQRGFNTGLCYFCLQEPAFGNVLYVQNLTALNPYFQATKTKPDGVVGGEWPELGYQPPTSPLGNSPPVEPLPKGVKTVISDALISFRSACANSEQESAAHFIDMLADIYPHLDRPQLDFRDWRKRADKTLKDLEKSPDARVEHYGHTYLHPYVAAEYPDSMVQMTVLESMREYEQASGKAIPLADDLAAGLGRFFDKKLGVVRRYLPNVGDDKNADAVDSWYLYHPLMNLARLARRGDKKARGLFLNSMDYAIRSARHFKYVWPIQYNVQDFSVITASRNEQGLGQTDVGGLYAYVMLQAYELTEDPRYLAEAKRALLALKEARFELVYQTNLTAWGAVACLWLWRLEKDPAHLAQSQVFVAGFLHNCELWDSQIEHARHYTNFFGVTCLHDAPYMAAYECFESFAAFDEYLRLGGADLPAGLAMLLAEYRRITLDRAWYFYPDALPHQAVAQDKIRNGHIDRKLSFPLEDVYGDGQVAGQVGQEVYGCGGAFIFASRAFFACGDNPLAVFADYPAVVEEIEPGKLAVRLQGPPGLEGVIRVLRKSRRAMPRIAATMQVSGEKISAVRRGSDFREYRLAANATAIIAWSSHRTARQTS